MALTLSLEAVQTYLQTPIPTQHQPRANAYLATIQAILTNRYGDLITATVEPFFIDKAAAALKARFEREGINTTVESQGAGAFNVRYNQRSQKGTWFTDAELAEMDQMVGKGGTRTYRTPAPDEIRRMNRMPVNSDAFLGDSRHGEEFHV